MRWRPRTRALSATVATLLLVALCVGAASAACASASSAQPTTAAVSVGVTVLPGIRMTFPAIGVVSVDSNTRFQLTPSAGPNGTTYTVVQD